MKTKSLVLGLIIFCLFLLTCKNDGSTKFSESNDFSLQATPIGNNDKSDVSKNAESNIASEKEEQKSDLPEIQIVEGEFERYRQKIFSALLKQKLVSHENALINFSHVCNLKTGKNTFLVVSLFELIKSPYSDRGYNRIVLLDSSLKSVNTLTVFADSSLFCDENKLYLHSSKIGFNADKISNNNKPIANSDNTIFFDDQGKVNGSQTTDFRELPALKERLKKGLTPQ